MIAAMIAANSGEYQQMISANGSGLTRIVSRKGLSGVNCRIVRKENLIPCLICENIHTYEYPVGVAAGGCRLIQKDA